MHELSDYRHACTDGSQQNQQQQTNIYVNWIIGHLSKSIHCTIVLLLVLFIVLFVCVWVFRSIGKERNACRSLTFAVSRKHMTYRISIVHLTSSWSGENTRCFYVPSACIQSLFNFFGPHFHYAYRNKVTRWARKEAKTQGVDKRHAVRALAYSYRTAASSLARLWRKNAWAVNFMFQALNFLPFNAFLLISSCHLHATSDLYSYIQYTHSFTHSNTQNKTKPAKIVCKFRSARFTQIFYCVFIVSFVSQCWQWHDSAAAECDQAGTLALTPSTAPGS